MLSGIAPLLQHGDDGYSRLVNFVSSVILKMVIIYSPDDTNVYGGVINGQCRGYKL